MKIALHPPLLCCRVSVRSAGVIQRQGEHTHTHTHTQECFAGQRFPECLSLSSPEPVCVCVVKLETLERSGGGGGKCCPKRAYHSLVVGICSWAGWGWGKVDLVSSSVNSHLHTHTHQTINQDH